VKVLVANNMDPFVKGGAEALADNLVANLIKFGHEAELMRIPFAYRDWRTIPAQMVAARTFELVNFDRLIALKFPTFLMRHPSKVVWLLHQYRQAYDLFDAGLSDIPGNAHGDDLRSVVTAADTQGIGEAQAIFTNSSVTADRLARYNGLTSSVLLPPLNDPEVFTGGPFGGYVFAGGRVNTMKRQQLLIQALPHTPPSVRLVIGGPPESPGTEDVLREMAMSLGVSDRVELDLRFLARSEIVELVNGSSACAYIPLDEDSLGYVAMEAAEAQKPIITCTDSGGVTQLVIDGTTGWLCEPDPFSLAAAMTQATTAERTARERGAAAHDLWHSLDITWERTIERLTV
jgi:glycosyltransferase involved in cell wall biosynthesis